MIGQPERCEGADDHEDEAAALFLALEASAPQAAEDGGVAGVDERERQQAAHDGLKEVLEDLVGDTFPVVWYTHGHSGVPLGCYFQVTGGEKRDRCV